MACLGEMSHEDCRRDQQFAASCRELAAKITDPKDKLAVELMAEAWDKVANDRDVALKRGLDPSRHVRQH